MKAAPAVARRFEMMYRAQLSLFFFFFSSRRRHTRLQGDWSSDVCSSDLAPRSALSKLPGDVVLSRLLARRGEDLVGIAELDQLAQVHVSRVVRDARGLLDRKSVV